MGVCNSPQAQKIYLKRVLETIARLNACLPTASGVQAISANLINLCSTFEGAQSVLDLQLKAAICWLGNGGAGGSCIRPDPSCDFFTVHLGTPNGPNLNIWDVWAKGLLFDDLEHAFGDMIFSQKGTEDPQGMPFLTFISAPLLTQVDGNLFTAFSHALLSVSFPLLTAVLGDCVVGSSNNLTDIDVHNLQTVGGNLDVGGVLTTTIDLSALISVGVDANLGATETIDCPNLTTVGGDILAGLSGPTTTIMMPNLTSLGGNVDFENAALNLQAVNDLLVVFAALGVTGRIFNLSGGTSAAPTGAGAAAVLTLQGQGNTVFVNP